MPTNYTTKSITNTREIMPSIVYNELFKLDPYDAILFKVSITTQNVKKVK